MSVCNRCSKCEENEECDGWEMGKSVGYCIDCQLFGAENVNKDEIIANASHSDRTTNSDRCIVSVSDRLVSIIHIKLYFCSISIMDIDNDCFIFCLAMYAWIELLVKSIMQSVLINIQ